MDSISTNRWPVGGWQFIEPLTGWNAPLPLSDNFEQTASKISDHRKANPHTRKEPGIALAMSDLMLFTRHRLNITEQVQPPSAGRIGACPACPVSR